jgi:hypothetical protein
MPEPSSPNTEHPAEPSSTGIERFKTWLIIGLALVILMLLLT